MSPAEAVDYGTTGPAVASFGHVRTVESPLTVVAERLRQAIEASGLWVLHEIDPQAIVARAGYMIDSTHQILFFHPDLMARLLRADPAALLEAPLKFAVMSLPQGGVSIRWLDPATAFARYSHPELDALGKELTAICETIAAKVVA